MIQLVTVLAPARLRGQGNLTAACTCGLAEAAHTLCLSRLLLAMCARSNGPPEALVCHCLSN